MSEHKPIIETIINTTALALIAYAMSQITTGQSGGYLALGVGMLIEFIKYFGRKKKLW